MVSSVSSVSFKANGTSYDQFSRPGAYARPETLVQPETKKKSSAAKAGIITASVVAGALAIGGALLAGYKKGGLKVLEDVKKAEGFGQKVGHYLGKAGEWLDDKVWTNLTNRCKKVAEKLKPSA